MTGRRFWHLARQHEHQLQEVCYEESVDMEVFAPRWSPRQTE